MNNDFSRVSYDPDADVLSWEMNDKTIAYAKEIKGIIIHFSAAHAPVLVEVLEATSFLARVKNMKGVVAELGAFSRVPKPALSCIIPEDFSEQLPFWAIGNSR